MALSIDFYVDDTATGAGDGSSWADAFPTIGPARLLAAGGQVVAIAKTHDEALTSWPLGNGSPDNPVIYISLDPADDSYVSRNQTGMTDGAKFTSTSLQLKGNCMLVGIWMDDGGTMQFGDQNEQGLKIIDCVIDCNVDIQVGGAVDSFVLFCYNSTLICNDIKQHANSHGATFHFLGCDLQANNPGIAMHQGDDMESCHWLWDSCDLTDWDEPFISTVYISAGGSYVIRNCQLGSGWTNTNGDIRDSGTYYLCENSSDGTNLSAPVLGLQHFRCSAGTIESSLSEYRTDGADDGEQANAYSWEMVTTANRNVYNPLYSPWCQRWVEGGSELTLTWYVAGGSSLNDDELWVELTTPDETSSSTTLYDYRRLNVEFGTSGIGAYDPMATAAALATDSGSTWNGTGVGTMQKISLTFTPDVAGPLNYRFAFAKSSSTVYVDPRVDGLATDGKEYFAGGLMINEIGGAGGGAGGIKVSRGMHGGMRG